MAKKFNLDPLITHTMNLDKINEAVEFMKTGKWQVSPLIFMSECLGQGEGCVGVGGREGKSWLVNHMQTSEEGFRNL